MIFSDNECPNCAAPQLHLNKSDLFECPNCHLVCASVDGILATVMPFLGQSNFRFEDCRIARFQGVAFAKSTNGTVIANEKEIFSSRDELAQYLSLLSAVPTKKTESQKLSEDFFWSFRKFILSCPTTVIREAWDSKPSRTNFYATVVMPTIASDLELIHGKEEFHVDYVMSKLSLNQHTVPKIFVESGNDFNSADHEIRKLCSLNAPFRVLITVTGKDFTGEPSSGPYGKLREWQSIVRSHNEQNQQFLGILGVVVARKTGGVISFQACSFRSNGDLLRPLSLLVEKTIGVSPCI